MTTSRWNWVRSFSRKKVAVGTLPPMAIALAVAAGPGDVGLFALAVSAAVTLYNPVYAVPMLIVATAFRQLRSVADIPFGWLMIAGCWVGAAFHVLIRSAFLKPIGIERSFLVLGFVWSLCGIMTTLNVEPGWVSLLYFLGTMGLLGVLSLVIGTHMQQRGLRHEENQLLWVYIVGIVNLAVLVSSLMRYSARDLAAARTAELSLRVVAFSPRPLANMFGLAAVVCLVTFVASRQSITERIAVLFLGLASTVGLVYTGARVPFASMILGTAVAILYAGYVRNRVFSRTTIRAILIITIAVVVLVALPTIPADRLPFAEGTEGLRLLREAELDDNLRFRIWSRYVAQITPVQLVFGSGVNGFDDMIGTNPHSVFVGAFSSFGMIGAAALLALLVFTGNQVLRARAPAAAGALVYSIVAMTTSYDINRPDFWVMLLVVLLIGRPNTRSLNRQNSEV